ncbi:MAG: type II toxin-antitoxin system RelE/ParE family toxin [Chthoniobacterales bacterium]
MAQIIRSAQAERDAVEIWAYIARDNPPAADHLLETFDEIFTSLSMQPHLGKTVEELATNLRQHRISHQKMSVARS